MRSLKARRQARRHIERADQISWALLIFGMVRMLAWTLMLVFTALGALGVSTFGWAKDAASLVLFVSFISYYANWATDLDAVTAAWAAIRAGKAHEQGLRNEQVGTAGHADVLARIEALAELIHDHQLRSER